MAQNLSIEFLDYLDFFIKRGIAKELIFYDEWEEIGENLTPIFHILNNKNEIRGSLYITEFTRDLYAIRGLDAADLAAEL